MSNVIADIRYTDNRLGDQKTTLQSARYVQSKLAKFGIYSLVLFNPTFPQGSDYENIDEYNEDTFDDGEFLFVNVIGVNHLNSDGLLQILEDKRRPAIEKLDRIMRDFNLNGSPMNIPVIQKLVQTAVQAKFDE